MRPTAAGARLAVRAADYWAESVPGASIAVDGVCLTVAEVRGDVAEFDVVGETLSRTTLGRAAAGRRVNLERAMRGDGRLDGHFVQGHVEGVGVVERVERGAGEEKWWFRVPAELTACMIPKGSIALDGISLTLVDVRDALISVVLVPTTLRVTTLGHKGPGDGVNIETDMIVRSIVRVMQQMGEAGRSGLTRAQLREAGFGA